MRLKWKLFIASMKMLLRQKEAILWSLVLPLFMILLFSFVRFDGIGRVELGIVNEAGVQASRLLTALSEVKTLKMYEGERETELQLLKKGERAIVLVVPSAYQPSAALEITAFTSEAKPQESQLGLLILQRVLDEITFAERGEAGRARLAVHAVESRNLTYFDFVAPGILSMSIMQLGIFGVAFGFVSMKKRGILRRLFVTPINPNDFIISSVAMRLVLVMMQIVIMTLVPYFFLDLHFIGSFWRMFVVGMVGAIVFLALGFAIAGTSKSEDQVAPLANIIAMPMMLLSGIFFSRDSLPGFVRSVVDLLPLSYLADAMRSIAIDDATLVQILPQLGGLGAWSVISIIIAVKMFRWE
ncbi:MAG: ABC transporter permease [Bacteroidetes bacterium]|nr:ABC transporter permease [Bacteroidota bacterium]MCW5894004.1 ABC transporter permease [Bacteroidota bacterium]